MTGRTHVLLGTVGALAASEALHAAPRDRALMAGAAFATSKLPDVDLTLRLRHRGITHTFPAAALVALAMAVAVGAAAGSTYAVVVFTGAFIGYGMHLVADRMTIAGLPGRAFPHLLPNGMRFRTGGHAESLLGLAVIALVVVYVFAQA